MRKRMNSLVVIVALQLQLLVLVLGLLCGGGVAAAAPQDLVNNLFSHSIPLSVPPPVNLVSEFRNWYFESDNLVLLLKTSAGEEGVSQRPAILITLHLDHPLALTSSGATDAAILVKSILDFLKDNHPSSVTAADLLFVFTRGDCIDSSVLLGSVAASRHPLFKNVIAFINVSAFGTFGETDKIVLHQANSIYFANLFKSSAKSPRMSVLRSEMERSFVATRNWPRSALTVFSSLERPLPGMELGLFGNNYLYNTPRDDSAHSSSSTQSFTRIAQTLASLIHSTVSDVNIISTLNSTIVDHAFTSTRSDFIYYDLPLNIHILLSKHSQLLLHLFLLITTGSLSFMIAVKKRLNLHSWKRFHELFLMSLFRAVASVGFGMALSVSISIVIGLIKNSINPGSSYGNPEHDVAWMIPLSILCYQVTKEASTIVCSSRSFKDKIKLSSFSRLTSLRKEYARINTQEEEQNGDENIHQLSPSAPTSTTTSTTTISPSLIPLVPLSSSLIDPEYNLRPSSTIAHMDSNLSSVSSLSLMLFWQTMTFVSFLLTTLGIQVLYLVPWFLVFSASSVLLKAWIDKHIRKFRRQHLKCESNVSPRIMRLVCLYECHSWALQLLVTTLIPAYISLFDTLPTLLSFLAPRLGDSDSPPLTVYMGPLALFIALLTANFSVISCSKRIGRRMAMDVILLGWMLIVLVWSCVIFPFSPNRPLKVSLTQVLDLDTGISTLSLSSLSKGIASNQFVVDKLATRKEWGCNVHDCSWQSPIPATTTASSPSSSLISKSRSMNVSITRYLSISSDDMEENIVAITGTFNGSSDSRICSIDVDYPSRWRDASFGIWLHYPTLDDEWERAEFSHLGPPVNPFNLTALKRNHDVKFSRSSSSSSSGGSNEGRYGYSYFSSKAVLFTRQDNVTQVPFLLRFNQEIWDRDSSRLNSNNPSSSSEVKFIIECYHRDMEGEGVGETIITPLDWMAIMAVNSDETAAGLSSSSLSSSLSSFQAGAVKVKRSFKLYYD